MYRQIVMHITVEDGYSESVLNSILSDAVHGYGGTVIEIEDHRDSCYCADDFEKGRNMQ